MSFHSFELGTVPSTPIGLGGRGMSLDIDYSKGCYSIVFYLNVEGAPGFVTVFGMPSRTPLPLMHVNDFEGREFDSVMLKPDLGGLRVKRRWQDKGILLRVEPCMVFPALWPNMYGGPPRSYVGGRFEMAIGPEPSAIDQLGSIAG